MKTKFLTRISDFLSSASSTSSSSSSSSSSNQDWFSSSKITTSKSFHQALGTKSVSSNKAHWATLNIGKKAFKKSKKRNDIPAAEWFASSLNADNREAGEPTEQSFYDEKVEILAPSASVASFISYSSTKSLPQHIPYYFSPLSTNPGLQHNKRNQDTKVLPLTPLKPIVITRDDSGIAVASKKIIEYRPIHKRSRSQIYNKDDFYD